METAMLSFSTLWIIYVGNFAAMALVWAYVARSYPNLSAARFWAAGTFFAAIGAALSLLRGMMGPLVPVLLANGLLLLAACMCMLGLQRFYNRRLSWFATAAVPLVTVAGLAWFLPPRDDMAIRIVIYSMGQIVPLALTLPLLLSRDGGRGGPGARLTGVVAVALIALYVVRSVAAVLRIDGEVSFIGFNGLQASLVVLLMFAGMAWNFGFLLMAIDRLRAEVADLALLDDLTGVANRRHLLRKLTEECALSRRTRAPFVLLVLDLDGFKEINDGYGHAAGDECLRYFTRAVQSRLRPGDLLARAGGDEFSVVLPATSLQEGAVIARRLLDACQAQAVPCGGTLLPLAASIGVAQWTEQVGHVPERLIAAADQALYIAKNEGKNRFALYTPAPSLAPDIEAYLPVGIPQSVSR
jgi:diguanylate cyclase (GGDEF)-like protein